MVLYFIIVGILQTIALVHAEYAPVLSWDVCSPTRIVVTLTGAAEGGIIYIRGYGAACRQTTSANQTQHNFDFQSCGIVTGETYFTIIVQKNPLYQTGSDLQESLLCIYDLSDITVGNNVNAGDKDDDAGINKTVKPTGSMTLYKDGIDIGGQNVKLSDLVTMTIQLDDEYIVDFDIKAISCTANFIDLIVNFCAAETALFPNFQHVAQGVVTSTFGAFRTTDLGGGYVEMIFSCTVQVCRGLCTPEACSNGEEGWGRRRRQVSDNSRSYEELNIGASFSVGTEQDGTAESPHAFDSLCIDNTVFILLLVTILGVLVTSLSLTVHVTTKLMKRNDELRNLTGINNRQRKSLIHVVKERRKSSIPMFQRNISLSFGTVRSSRSIDLDSLKSCSVDTDKHRQDDTRNAGTKDTKGTVLPAVALNSIKYDKSIFKTNTTPKESFGNDSFGSASVLNSDSSFNDSLANVQITAKHSSTVQYVSNRSDPIPSVSSKLEAQTGSGFEALLGIDGQKLKMMSNAEKRNKMLECKALLEKLAKPQTQK